MFRRKHHISRILHRSYSAFRKNTDESLQRRCDTYANAIRSCRNPYDGHALHRSIVENGLTHDRLLMNLLVEMYGKLGDLNEAYTTFCSIQNPNTFSWTILLVAYAQNGHLLEALQTFRRMDLEGIKPTLVTCTSIVAVCASLEKLSDGETMHRRIVESGYSLNSVVENTLVNMYGKCGNIEAARAIFEEMFQQDVISWTSIVSAYAQHGYPQEAIAQFQRMQQEGIQPNDLTFSSVLQACSSLCYGRSIHSMIRECGISFELANGSEIVSMYGRCESVEDAEKVLVLLENDADATLYNAMSTVYSERGQGRKVLELFERMKCPPDEGTYARVLPEIHEITEGRAIHDRLGIKRGLVLETSLVKMYINCGCLEEATHLFERMHTRDMYCWTVMITAFVEKGYAIEALEHFQHTRLEGLGLNKVVLVSVLDACVRSSSLQFGRTVHEMATSFGYCLDAVLGSVLVSLYGQCGILSDARMVFESVDDKDVVCWNTMIGSYAQHGRYKESLVLFQRAILDGVVPSEVTFQCVLFACSHAGKVYQGWLQFVSMIGDHGGVPNEEHFRCMVDLLGRAGHIEDAEELINTMPFVAADVAWTMLLAACRVHKDVVRAKRIAKQVMKTDVDLTTEVGRTFPYLLLSNMYFESNQASTNIDTT